MPTRFIHRLFSDESRYIHNSSHPYSNDHDNEAFLDQTVIQAMQRNAGIFNRNFNPHPTSQACSFVTSWKTYLVSMIVAHQHFLKFHPVRHESPSWLLRMYRHRCQLRRHIRMSSPAALCAEE